MTDQTHEQHDKYNVTNSGDKFRLTINKYFDTQEEAVEYAEHLPEPGSDPNLNQVKQDARDHVLAGQPVDNSTTSTNDNNAVHSEASSTDNPNEASDGNSSRGESKENSNPKSQKTGIDSKAS